MCSGGEESASKLTTYDILTSANNQHCDSECGTVIVNVNDMCCVSESALS